MSANTTLVWFRSDLRLEDNPALRAASRRGGPVIPVFVWAPGEERPWEPGAASKWWLHQSLCRLGEALEKKRSRLILREGKTLETLRTLVRETGAGAVFWNRRYEPRLIDRDAKVTRALARDGIETESFNANLLFEPDEIRTRQGGPYKVYTPFYNACIGAGDPPEPERAPRKLGSPTRWPRTLRPEKLQLEPEIDWAGGIRETWRPGERGARSVLERFLEEGLAGYPDGRDRPDNDGTSRLSPYLHFGEISPREAWHTIKAHGEIGRRAQRGRGAEAHLRQLVWREFAHHLLVHFPHTTDQPLREQFARFPWKRNAAALRAWQKGRTGYPIVDAGMRQLWKTGWMHNRVRMIVASFLVKDLLIPWQEGARWFWDTLVDADLANNTLGWQWTAGCGADAAPYFRIFNPVTQGTRYDPDGDYVRRYVPELASMPARYIHQPWKTLIDIDGAPGSDYPEPLIDHGLARTAALEAYDAVRKPGGNGR